MRGRRKFLYIILAAAVLSLIIQSCSEGIFNFSDETGNLSFSFVVDSYGGDDISSVVLNFSNSEHDVQLRRELEFYGDSVDCYISRVDTGPWTVYTTVYLSDGTIAVERTDYFELELAETAMAELSYWSDGTNRNLDISWEAGTSTEIASAISVDKLDTLITAFHTMGGEQSSAVTMIAQGSGFDTYLNGLRIELPDSTFVEYTGGWARGISGFEIETGASYLTATIDNYSSRGDYSLIVTDQNDVETTAFDDCNFNFDPESGYAMINNWDGTLPLLSADYNKNESDQAGSYLFYVVSKSDGTWVNEVAAIPTPPVVVEDISAATDLDVIPGPVAIPAAGMGYLVIATIDADLTQAEIDAVFVSGTTNLAPDNLPSWLYSNFGDRINFVGLSVAEN